MGDVSVKQERISVLCPITQARMQRPGRGSACRHAAAFCISALPAIRAGDGHYRCPICSITFAEADIVSDVALLLFIAEHPSASHLAVVRRGDATSGIPWAYRKASQARHDVPKPKHAQPKRPRTTTHSDAAPGPSQLPAGGARGSVSRPIKLEDDAEEATARETAAAAGPAARVRVPKFEWALPLQPVAPPVAPHATPTPTPTRTPRGSALSAAAMAAASVRRHATAHAAAPPCGAASAAAGAAAAERQLSESGCGGAAPSDGHACPAAFGSSKSAAPSERPAGRSSSDLVGQARKAQQRRERREAAKRTELLAKVKEALIRRALHEDHPEDCGGASLWE